VSADLPITDRERQFIEQSNAFLATTLGELGLTRAEDVPQIQDRAPVPLRPTILHDYESLTSMEMDQIANDYYGEFGVSCFVVKDGKEPNATHHPLLVIADQLREILQLQYPITHPLETHPERLRRFGPADGTIKLYDLNKDPQDGYREQGETSELFAAHNDGLGYAGTVRSAAMYLDSPPLWGGYTFFSNILLLSLNLLNRDEAAFQSLFLPNAITALRPRGKGAIKVTCPVLFINSDDQPSMFFRVTTGEYAVTFRQGVPALDRAVKYLTERAIPFGLGSSFAHLSSRGHGCISRNQHVVHGRTEFIDSEDGWRRILARKWFMSGQAHTEYKHVPGMALKAEYANLYPEYFGLEVLTGEWQYDKSTDSNRRVK
jgi:hypothetical protein